MTTRSSLKSPRKNLTLALALLMTGSATFAQAPTQPRAQGPALKAATPVTLNFVNADIEAVTRAIGVMMNRQFVIDPRVKGQITLYSEQQVSVHEAYLNYLAALRTLGFTVVESGGLYKVVPEADAKLQTGTVTVDEGSRAPRGDQVITQIFRINHENANNLVAVLRPLISPNNTINANPGNNSLVITDYAENLQRLAKVIAALDTPGSTDIEIVPLKYSVASDMAALAQKLAEGGGAAIPGVPAVAAGSNAVSVIADPRTNSLILRASNPQRLAAAREIVKKLDQPTANDTTGGSNIHVVYLKNADAAKLATVLRAAFSANGAAGSGSSGGSSGSSGSSSLGGSSQLSSSSQNSTTSSLNSSSSSSGGSGVSSQPVASSPSPSTGGFVQADPATNSLIITAPEVMYRQIRNVIDQLDGRRAQVYVESMIVKVDVTKSGQFGFQWQNLFGKSVGLGTNFGTGSANIISDSVATAGGTTTAGTALQTAQSGLNFAVFKKIGGVVTLGALANFLESQTGANVLSTPNLVALDNEEAKIVIGQNVPFVTGSYTTSTTGTSSPFQTVDRKDVGLTLRIRSQIGENGTIRMTVYQENSSVVATTASSTNGPTTDKSSIETTVTVDDGSILVLGGLLKDEYSDGEDGVPGLASLPVVGNLFKSNSRKRIKTNLMVFLRPVVLRDQASADELTLDRYEAIRAVQQATQPTKTAVLPDTGASVIPADPTSSSVSIKEQRLNDPNLVVPPKQPAQQPAQQP